MGSPPMRMAPMPRSGGPGSVGPGRYPTYGRPPMGRNQPGAPAARMPYGNPRSMRPAFIPVPLSPGAGRAPAFRTRSTNGFSNFGFRRAPIIRPPFNRRPPIVGGGFGFGPGFYGGFGFNPFFGLGFGFDPFFGYGFDPFFFGDGFACDPYSLMFYGGPMCFNPFLFNPYATYFYGGAYSPYYDPYSFYGNPYVWDGFDQYPAGPNISSSTSDQSMTPLQSSVYISSGGLPGLTPPPSSENAAAGAEANSASSTPGSEAAIDAASRPPTRAQAFAGENGQANPAEMLVFTDGSSVLVSQCWLGDDWQLHYVTATGETKTIPLDHLNLQATATANNQRGVSFQLPLSPQQQQQPNPQPQQQ
jgi:hypothetical protein